MDWFMNRNFSWVKKWYPALFTCFVLGCGFIPGFDEWPFDDDSDMMDTNTSTDFATDCDTSTNLHELTLWGPGSIQIAVDGEYRFPSINIQSRKEVVFTIENSGRAKLVIKDIALVGPDSDQFEVDTTSMPTHLLPGEETSFSVAFEPTSEGPLESDVSIISNATEFEFKVIGDVIEFHGIASIDTEGDVGRYSSISAEDDVLHIAYYDETNHLLKYMKSTNGGIDWISREIRYENGQIGRGASIAADGDNVFISTTIENNGRLLSIAQSHDGGNTWNAERIEVDGRSQGNQYYSDYSTSIALSGTDVFIAYLGRGLQLSILKGSYDGSDWILRQFLPAGGNDESGYHASVEVVGDQLYVSHTGYTYNELYMTVLPLDLSTDEVMTVQESDTDISYMSESGYTSLAADGDTLYIAFYDEISDANDLKLAKSFDGGSVFETITIDDSGDIIGKYPSIAVVENYVYISYFDQDNYDLKIAISSDNGLTWSHKLVDPTTDDVGPYSSLAAYGDNVCIVYYDVTNKDLKFAKSVDHGETWN